MIAHRRPTPNKKGNVKKGKNKRDWKNRERHNAIGHDVACNFSVPRNGSSVAFCNGRATNKQNEKPKLSFPFLRKG